MDFQTVARIHLFRINREKNANFTTKVWYPRSHSGCFPIVSKHVPNRPRLSGSLIQRKPDRTTFECWFASPWECGGLPYGHTVRVSWYQKMTSKEAFLSSVWLSAHRMLVKVCSFEKGKPLKESVFSSLYLSRTGLESGKCVSLHFLCLVNTSPGHTGSTHEERAAEVCLGVLGYILWLLRRCDIPLEMG